MKPDQNLTDQRQWVLATVDRFERPLTRYARRLLDDDHAARDAVQHTFLQLCDQSPSKLGDSLTAWLFTVCRNKVLDIVRKRDRSSEWDEEGPEFSGREPDPASHVETEDLHRCLLELVSRLPDSQREAIDLWTQGFSYREIAGITQRGEGAVRVLVHRAITRLRENPTARSLLADRRTRNEMTAS